MFTSITINNIIIISFFYYDVLLCEFEMMVYCSLAWSVNNIFGSHIIYYIETIRYMDGSASFLFLSMVLAVNVY